MPNREELHDESVFADHGNNTATVPAAVGGGSHAHSEPRDMTPTGTAAREPFDFSDPNANDVAMEAKNEEAEPSMEEVVSRLIIHEDKPIENLPTMSAPELKLIGRCVSFCLTRTINEEQVVYHYTGLVASVTFTAVTLMHVTRYTRADFKEYVAREKRVTKESGKTEAQSGSAATAAEQGMNASAAADGSAGPSGLPAHGYTAEGEVGIGNDGGLTGTQDATALLRMDAAGSLAPAVQLITGDDTTLPVGSSIADTTQEPPTTRAMRRRNFYRCDASIGPLPFATFLRKSLHDVRFGRDPRSSFYNLFHEPLKEIEDMHFLRMFVRRYLVHTAEGNNPRQVPLYAFVTVRCGCPEMDRELVYRVAREELPDLMKADKSIAKEKRKQERQAVQREQTLRAYQAPEGLFSHTGILYVTRLPQITFMTAMLIFVFVIVFAIYLGVSLGVLQDPLMAGYERQLLRYFIPSLIVWAIAGIAVTLHSLYARLPLRTTFVAMVMRCIWSVGAVACAAMVIGVIAQHLKNEKLYAYMSTAKQSDLCGFYNLYGCSGFWVQCSATLDGPCSPYCARLAGLSYSQPCYAYLWNRAQLLLIPLVVFAAMLLCLVLYSVFMLWKLWSTVNHISSRLR